MIESIRQGIPKLSYFDPSDIHCKSLKGKYADLVLHTDTANMTENDIVNANRVLLDRTGAPENLWFLVQDYLVHVYSLSTNFQLNWKIPEQVSRGGGTPDISHIPMFYWFETVMYLDPVSKIPETTERPGYFE